MKSTVKCRPGRPKKCEENLIEMIKIQYTIEEGRANYALNKAWASVPVSDLVVYDDDINFKMKVTTTFNAVLNKLTYFVYFVFSVDCKFSSKNFGRWNIDTCSHRRCSYLESSIKQGKLLI